MSKPSRPTLTERRAEELRLTIANTARDMFVADGDTSATVERICETVGIAPRTFHRHFPVKEDVIGPLFRRSQALIIDFLQHAPADADAAETLARAFTTEVHKRKTPESDRKFMTLMINTPQYRLRWLEWGEQLCGPITEFLSARVDLGDDPFLRKLPAELIVHTSRQAYIQWVDTEDCGDFSEVEALQLRGMKMLLDGLRAVMAQPAVSAP
ncbi:TetR/AcrR family transcriptional regulator [Nocardia sp. NPDC052254]|uniref:TetR/AcrR family transcriptional regulator n=1 Tax=Nocardia sp. NPDC052254 TaxID=3155681 RepID=UPI003420CDA8